MIRDQQNDPNISPFQYTPLYPALISILEDISAQVAYGSLSPTLADQYMQYIMTGWSEALYYFQSTYFIYQAKMWTAYQGGDPSIWDGIIVPPARDRNGFN